MSKFINESWLVLVMGIVFAAMLAGAQQSLSDRIEENQLRALNEAIAEVVPGTTQSESIEIEGFVDKIRLVVGIDPAGEKIVGLKVIENVETPGLGNKIQDPEWAGQYIGLDTSREIKVEKRPPNEGANEIQAITGATWSSRYVTDIVNAALPKVRPELDKHR